MLGRNKVEGNTTMKYKDENSIIHIKKLHVGTIAGVPTAFRNYERKNDIKSDVVDVTNHPFKYEYDFSFPVCKKDILSIINILKLIILCTKYDIIHYHKRVMPSFYNLDILIMKYIFKKRIIMHYHGSELRDGIEKPVMYSDKIFVSTPDLLKFVDAEYVINPILIKPCEKIKNWEDGITRILHTPTNEKVKGTKYITDAVHNSSHNIAYKCCSGHTHKKNLRLIKACDIYIDQLIIGSAGVSTFEALAMGKIVLCNINNDGYDNTPIINVTKHNIHEILEQIIQLSLDEKIKIQITGIEYIKTLQKQQKLLI